METTKERCTETREEALARIRRAGRPARTVEELYGPLTTSDDPDDLEAFLDLLETNRRPVSIPGGEM